MSSLAQPMTHPISSVTAPTATTTLCAVGLASKIGWDRAIRYTPAVTMVAAWMSAETGVGPSMASGSHTCSGSRADFPTAPANSNRAITVAGPFGRVGGPGGAGPEAGVPDPGPVQMKSTGGGG